MIILNWLALALAGLLAVGDILTTLRFLREGGTEANPIARWLFARVGVLPGAVLLKLPQFALLGAAAIIAPGHWAVLFAAIGLAALNGYAVLHNVEYSRRLDR